MAWFYLTVAGLLEIVWALGLKFFSQGTSLQGAGSGSLPSFISWMGSWMGMGTVLAMVLSFVFLAQAMKTLPLGTSYAVWTGIGAAGSVLCGILFFGEPRDFMRLLCLGLILSGTLGLKFLVRS